MSRKKPNIITPHNNKGAKNDLILNVFNDSFVSSHTPDSISLDGTIFTLTLSNKKFVYEEIKVDVSADYVDIYLQTVKLKAYTYNILEVGTDIIVTFNQAIVSEPGDIVASDFQIRGKIVSR
tara:strand:+ start:2596 stop:2961 length:366 start_codon:yes stop_codon:yes gene_type:complete